LLLEYKRGVNLFDAPNIAEYLFIGRGAELLEMQKIRKVRVLGGMGGIGKTQLSIAYVKRHADTYSSVFWLNATSEVALKSSFRSVARRISGLDTVDLLEDDQVGTRVSNWFCELNNSCWLLIYDNYDDPDEYDITKYYPQVMHGSIIVTTRVPARLMLEN